MVNALNNVLTDFMKITSIMNVIYVTKIVILVKIPNTNVHLVTMAYFYSLMNVLETVLNIISTLILLLNNVENVIPIV